MSVWRTSAAPGRTRRAALRRRGSRSSGTAGGDELRRGRALLALARPEVTPRRQPRQAKALRPGLAALRTANEVKIRTFCAFWV